MYECHGDVTAELKDGVLWLRLGKGGDVGNDLITIFKRVNDDPEVRVVVLVGEAEKVFCVGSGAASPPADRDAYWFHGMQEARDMVVTALECEKPIIGGINGHAIGKGCSLAICCDITIMAEEAKIGDTHVKLGLACGDGGSLMWPLLLGPVLAKRYLFTGDLLDGREAARIGLVTEAVPRAEIAGRITHWADRLAKGAPHALRMTKRAMHAALRAEATHHMDMSLGLETLTFLTADHKEAAAAFTEQREPVFKGG